MIPRPVVTLVVLVLLAVVVADVGGQFAFPGHTANTVLDGGIIALIGAIITGTRGPKPEDPPPPPPPVPATEPPAPTTPLPAPSTEAGRHHRSEATP